MGIIVEHANHCYRFVVRTNTIIYNYQQQQKQKQKKEKESGKECYYCLYCSHHSTIQYIINCTRKVFFVTSTQQLTTQMMTQTMTQQLTPYNLVIITLFVFVCVSLFLFVCVRST